MLHHFSLPFLFFSVVTLIFTHIRKLKNQIFNNYNYMCMRAVGFIHLLFLFIFVKKTLPYIRFN